VRWDDAEWRAWRPDEAAARLAGLTEPWCVTAGWALDLFVGEPRREHEDLEVAVPAHAFTTVRSTLGELEWHAPVGHEKLVAVADAPERLEDTHQTWGLDREANAWRIDVFREPSSGGEWVCRRDDRIRLPYGDLIERTADGIPYARPEVVLLFKAKAARVKDEADLRDVLPLLGERRRTLLRAWLELAHPGHAWLAVIG
jgi:hypothetical protein